MSKLVSKAEVRREIETMHNGNHHIYSTANIKSGEYRISIPWNGRWRRCSLKAVPPQVWNVCNEQRDQLVADLVAKFPELKGHINTHWHIGAGIYLSLRIDNSVLTR